MGVKIADKLEQFNNGSYYLVDSSAVEYVDKDGVTKSVKEVLDSTPTDVSTHKTTIYENNIDMGKYLLLAKITGANYANNIIKFSCPNYKGTNDTGFRYEDDMDIYKFELHFNTGSRKENNGYGVTLKQHGLGLYSYPLSNPKNTEPRLEEAIRLYWDYSKGDIYVFLVDMMTAIPHCVLEYTGSGTLLKKDTFVMDDLYNRRDGLNGTWEESKWKSIPFNKLEVPPIYELGGEGSSAEGITTYTTIEELGLTAPVTVGEIFNAMSDNTMAIISCEEIEENTKGDIIYVSDVPTAFGILTIKKNALNRFSIEYQNSLGGTVCNVRRWIGTLKGLDGTGLIWKEILTDEGVVITEDMIAYYGTEILKYPVGTWRINNINIGNQFTDLPLKNMGAVIEISSIDPNRSPYENRYGYRNYIFKSSLDGIIYIRTLNSGDIAGTLQRDSGWQKIGISNTLGLVDNSQYFKISITKNNPYWYGNLKFSYVSGTSPTEVDITITNAIYYTITKGYNTIESITYTADGVNITIGIKCTTTMYGTQTVELPSEFGTINSLTGDVFTGDTTATLKGGTDDTRVTTLETQVNELFQSVSNGKTAVANAITDKGVSTSSTATFATMATNIGKIGGSKEETKSYNNTSAGISPITLTFSANVLGIKGIIPPSDMAYITPQTSANMFRIEGKSITIYVTGSGTWKVTALIKA